MSEVGKYRKRPVVIEAVQWDGTALGAGPVINWILDGDGSANYYAPGEWAADTPDATYLSIQTLEGRILASPLDWIIRGIQGEFYPCKPDIFEKTYEQVFDEI